MIPVQPIDPAIVTTLHLGGRLPGQRIGYWRSQEHGGGSPYHVMLDRARRVVSGELPSNYFINGVPARECKQREIPDLEAKAAAYDALPWPGDHCDPNMSRVERERVATLLDAAPIVASYCGSSSDRLAPDVKSLNGSGERSVAGWIWPTGLSHYVRAYGLVLCDEFVQALMAAT